MANANSNNVSVLFNTTSPGATTPTFGSKTDFATGTLPVSVTLGDLDFDGRLDVVAANQSANSVSVLLNATAAGNATPSFAAKVDFTTGPTPQLVAISDIDGDGRRDLAVTAFNGGVSVLRNTTTSAISFATKVDFTTGSGPEGGAVGDVNGDGIPDVCVVAQSANVVSVLLNTTARNTTTPTFAAKTDFATSGAPYWMAIGIRYAWAWAAPRRSTSTSC